MHLVTGDAGRQASAAPMPTPNTTDQPQKPPPEPMEDPTGHGTLEQLAKRGVGGAQVLAEKLTGSDPDRYLSAALLHAHSHTVASNSIPARFSLCQQQGWAG